MLIPEHDILSARPTQTIPSLVAIAGHSRRKDGVASARPYPGHPRLFFDRDSKDVNARDKPGMTEWPQNAF
jgi:hypothetical protein